MKKIGIIVCVMLMILCLTACGNKQGIREDSSTDYFQRAASVDLEKQEQPEEAFIDIEMTVYDRDKNIIDVYKDDSLVYQGEPFEFYVRVKNCAEFPVTICLSALMQSHLQPFIVDGTEEEVMGSTVALKGKEYHDFHMYVTPIAAYTNRDTLLQYVLYTTKGIEAVKTGSMGNSTFATMSQIAIKAGDKSNEHSPKKSDMAKAEKEEKIDERENSLGVVARVDDKWQQPPMDIDMSQKQNAYVCTSGGSTEDMDVTKYMLLSYVDGQLVKGFHGKYQGVFEKKEGVLNYFSIDNDVIHTKGEHVISTVLIPLEYRNKDESDKIKLLEQRRYWVILGNEGVFNFQ